MRADSFVEGSRCQDFALEWLDTNGIGGYAMGTVAGIRTRRYHSLLNSGKPTHVWLSSFEDRLHLDGQTYELAAHEYPGGAVWKP